MRAGGNEEDKQDVFVQVTLHISACRGEIQCTALKEMSPHAYGSGSSTTRLVQAQVLLCRVTVQGFQGSCHPQYWAFGAPFVAGCAEMGRVVTKRWQEGRSALASTSIEEGPTAPTALNRPHE